MTSEAAPAAPEPPSTPPKLEMRGITKRYPGVVANDHIDLDLRQGEIHALRGENGAGKSTLMNILYGLAVPDEGEILLDGAAVAITGPSDAIARGISMVHQHFMLVPVLTVAENILLGEETMANVVFLDRTEAHKRIVDLGHRFGFEIDPEAKVESLSVGWQQRVEILKALYRQARILVLDEPTAVLTPQETSEIFAVLRRLAAEGHSIIFISHKLYEVLEIADRITVIRRGRVVGTRIPQETNEDNLVLTSYYRAPYANGPVRNDAAIDAWAEESIKAYDIRTPSATVPASTLSGGNQQKVIVAREFSGEPRLLVLDQPTRGLDVGSIEFIHRQAIAKRDAGTAVLLVSAELDEVLELSDRIAVMYRGEIVAVRDGRTADREEIGLLMATGGREPLEVATTTMAPVE